MASTYQTVSYGSRGDAVRQLQSALNRRGYQLAEDGVFGAKTREAVRDYQKKNGLQLDGVAGQQTWGHLMAAVTPPAVPTTGKQVLTGVSDETADALERLQRGYVPSGDVTAAWEDWQDVASRRPAAYQSAFAAQLDALYRQIRERPEFAYDPAADEAYGRYAALYAARGRRAMEDTVGRTAALTGGYASTYAHSAGQQAYQTYLQQLAELMPQLEQSARDRYEQRGKALVQQYQLLQGQDEAAYGRWQDAVKAWQSESESARRAYETAEKSDRATYQALLSHFLNRAKAEQAASGDRLANTGVSADPGKGISLSSTAGDSLRRTMERYLKDGKPTAATTLARQYRTRMTPAQKKRFSTLFRRYGVGVDL